MPTAPVQQAALQICQPGYDIRNCPDWVFLFNSNWQSLTIAFETTVTGPTIVPHNLGFPPLNMSWQTANNLSWGRNAAEGGFSVDNQNIYVSLTGTFTIRCYNIDISQEAAYPLPTSASAKLPYNNQFGLKLAKNNRSITSNNLNDFIIHTRGQSPAILNVCTYKGQYYDANTGTMTYPLQTSYIPWIAGFIDAGGVYTYFDISNLNYNASNNSVSINVAFGTPVLVIMRDPLFYPNTVRMVY